MVRRNSGERLKRKVQTGATKSSAAGLRAFVLRCKRTAHAAGTAVEERARLQALSEDARRMLTVRAFRARPACSREPMPMRPRGSRLKATPRIARRCDTENRNAMPRSATHARSSSAVLEPAAQCSTRYARPTRWCSSRPCGCRRGRSNASCRCPPTLPQLQRAAVPGARQALRRPVQPLRSARGVRRRRTPLQRGARTTLSRVPAAADPALCTARKNLTYFHLAPACVT